MTIAKEMVIRIVWVIHQMVTVLLRVGAWLSIVSAITMIDNNTIQI